MIDIDRQALRAVIADAIVSHFERTGDYHAFDSRSPFNAEFVVDGKINLDCIIERITAFQDARDAGRNPVIISVKSFAGLRSIAVAFAEKNGFDAIFGEEVEDGEAEDHFFVTLYDATSAYLLDDYLTEIFGIRKRIVNACRTLDGVLEAAIYYFDDLKGLTELAAELHSQNARSLSAISSSMAKHMADHVWQYGVSLRYFMNLNGTDEWYSL